MNEKHPEPGFLGCYCHWPTTGTWAGHIPSLGLRFSICTMGERVGLFETVTARLAGSGPLSQP